MKNRIDTTFARLKTSGRAAFMPFLTCGDPAPPITLKLLHTMDKAGADMIELGIPYSDPVADGAVIQASYTRALNAGTLVRNAMETVRAFRQKSDTPIVAMVSHSIVHRKTPAKMIKALSNAGFDGIIVPDLPVEEAGSLSIIAKQANLHPIFLIAPSTTPQRQAMIMSHCSGFLYYITVMGTTGARNKLAKDLKKRVLTLKKQTPIPVAAGFGVSNAQQAAQVASFSDGVIIGSALIKLIEKYGKKRDLLPQVRHFIHTIASSI